MKKIIMTLALVAMSLVYTNHAMAEDFIGSIQRLAVDNGNNYGGVRYLELIFADVTDLSGTPMTPAFVYYAIPIEDESAFPYMFAILKYADTRNQTVRISSQTNWVRSDGFVFGRVTYVE